MSDTPELPTQMETTPEEMTESIKGALRQVYDPEIPVNIYDLGLVYGIQVAPDLSNAKIEMTLTTPNCPAAEYLPVEVQQRAEEVMGAGKVVVDVVWDPPWSQDNMTEEAMLELGLI